MKTKEKLRAANKLYEDNWRTDMSCLTDGGCKTEQGLLNRVDTPGPNDDREQVRVGRAGADGQKLTGEMNR